MTDIGGMLSAARGRLRAAGVTQVEVEVECLRRWAQEADGWESRFRHAVELRVQRVPFSHIAGRRAFWKHEFEVTPAVLDPRPESETVVECVLEAVGESLANSPGLRILDLGTGSGCLLVSLLTEIPTASGFGVDCSHAALAVAQRNLDRAGLAKRATLEPSDWLTSVHGCYDIVVCNPPYVAHAEFATLEPEVAEAEPRLALDGGADGLCAYRTIAPQLSRVLNRNGMACFEFGAGQADAVCRIFRTAGWRVDSPRADLDGRPRCVLVRPPTVVE